MTISVNTPLLLNTAYLYLRRTHLQSQQSCLSLCKVCFSALGRFPVWELRLQFVGTFFLEKIAERSIGLAKAVPCAMLIRLT